MKILPIISTTAARGCGSGCSRSSVRAPDERSSAGAGPLVGQSPATRSRARKRYSDVSLLAAEVFTIPIDGERFVVYAPLRTIPPGAIGTCNCVPVR